MDFNALSVHVLQYARQLLPEILPGGRINGNEYECSNLYGGNGDSLRVNLNKGIWCDFADENVKGGDLISLYAAVYNIPMHEAYEELSNKYNFKDNISKFNHFKFGDPVSVWKYNDNFFIARYETSKGKEYRPIQIIDNKKIFKAPDIRPLYNRNKIVNNPSLPILIVEGEKACDAAEIIAGARYICTTWAGGAKAIYKADWTVIRNRNVLICPDADKAGISAADNIAQILNNQDNKIKIIDPNGKPKGWDLADALDDGWGWEQFLDWAKPRAIAIKTKEENITINAMQINVNTDDVPEISGSSIVLWDKLGLVLTSSGNPVANIDNVIRVFSGLPDMRNSIYYDNFFKRIFINGELLTDEMEYEITVYLQGNIGLSQVKDTTISKAIRLYAKRNQRNEPQEWIKSLVWDRKQRIDTFLHECVGCKNNEYTQAVSRNFMLSMIARIMSPGCKCDTMIILEGKQGKKKSTFLRSLVGDRYFTEATESIHSNNFYQCLDGKILIEFAELAAWKRADIFKLKQMLSNQNDTYRAPYARNAADHLRSSIFAGTTNEDEYLEDLTGGRRFWPIATNEINISKTRDIREQLFAEAYSIYMSETPEFDEDRTVSAWWEMPESAFEEQENRRNVDPWEADIREYIISHSKFTMKDIMESCLKIEKSKKTKYETMRIGRILAYIGCRKFRESTGSREYYYVSETLINDEDEWE